MKFCPKCEAKLKRGDSGGLQCPKCGHAEESGKAGAGAAASSRGTKEEAVNTEFNVFEGDEGEETHPTIKIECEKCGHGEAIWWMLQTRSADEPTTQFYRCTKCQHTWRNYA